MFTFMLYCLLYSFTFPLPNISCRDSGKEFDLIREASSLHDSDTSSDAEPLVCEDINRSIPNLVRIMSIGCPRTLPSETPRIHKTSIILVSPTTFEDVVVEIKPDDLEWSVNKLIQAGFNLNQPSVMYLPGWKEPAKIAWLRRVRRKYANLFREGKRPTTFNLVFYDYYEDNKKVYNKAVRKAPGIGKNLADFMNALKKYQGYKADQVHIIGYSMSAHVAGIAGKLLRLTGNPLRQISALDPAGPCFFGKSDFAKEYTLSPDSADLVVARHYGFGMLGAKRSVGGVDVFVNGGHRQPKCIRDMHKFYIMRISQQNHRSSAFHEALALLNGSCYDMAYECEDYDAFLDGACANCDDETKCLHIGTLVRGANRSPLPKYRPGTKMFLQTGGRDYCLHQYQLVVVTSTAASQETISAFQAGKVSVNFGKIIDETVPQRMTTCDGYPAFTALVTSKEMLSLKYATLYNKRDHKFIASDQIRLLRLNYMSHPFRKRREEKSLTLCPHDPDLLGSDFCMHHNSTITCL